MKKYLMLGIALCLGGLTSLGAQAEVSAWGRGFLVTAANPGGTDAETRSYLSASWGGLAPHMGLTISGDGDTTGFMVELNTDGSAIKTGDNVYLWAKPLDMARLAVGKLSHNTLRGDGAFGSFSWLRVSSTGEDLTFARFRTDTAWDGGGNLGAVLSLDPAEGLHAFAGFHSLDRESLQVLRNASYGAGYTMEGLGQLKAQFVGFFKPDNEATTLVDESRDASYINGALVFTALPGFRLETGVFYPLDPEETKYSLRSATYATWAKDSLALHALGVVASDVPNYVANTRELALEGGLGLDLALSDTLKLSADVRYLNEAATLYDNGTKNIADGIGSVFVGVTKSFSNGLVGIGFQAATTTLLTGPAWGPEASTGTGTPPAKAPSWAIPIKFEYWF